ncbi:aminodeoxychorismate synthase component I [Brachybacterium hainanense]|uniref:Aminodeoxychorismate synthase component I n=1 Tax=Brachybacterium hainanense TaxID=1541174 RepID=A0ABV6RBW4_9MICO
MLHARFDDRVAGTILAFSACERVIEARTAEEVRPALRAVQAAVDGGSWAYGMLAYEAAAGLDPDARVRPGTPGFPLLRFGIAAAPDDPGAVAAAEERLRLPSPAAWRAAPWERGWTAAEHAERVARVRSAIAEGLTYQVNLTTRLRGRVEGDLLACYRDLVGAQQGAHGAYLDLGRWAVLSASPESFLHRRGERVRTAPMKGTAARGASPASDAAARADLLRSPKERAENVMIADLLRNDLARIARPGSVRVPRLLSAEAYPTLWQLTSTVEAEVPRDLGLEELMSALFPCGSITGAPKISTMGIIAELESWPRDVYCGAIGWLAPARHVGGEELPPEARFSVAIRTLLVDREDGTATYGVGGGITWASQAAGEWEELATKSRILAGPRTPPSASAVPREPVVPASDARFGLIETMAVHEGRPRHLAQHLDRLEASAARFAIPCDREALESLLTASAREAAPPAVAGDGPGQMLRLELSLDGTARISRRERPAAGDGPVLLGIDDEPRDPAAPEVRHKTTDRAGLAAALDRARGRDPRIEDVVLAAPGGLVTETTIANLVVRIGGELCTPPLEDGCLDGIGRRLLLERGEIRERSITRAELDTAEEIWLISSVRGLRRAVLARAVPAPARSSAQSVRRSRSS